MTQNLQAFARSVQQHLVWLRDQTNALDGRMTGVGSMVRQLREAGRVLFRSRHPGRMGLSYETVWLELLLDLQDARGRRAVLTRRQRVRFLESDGAVIRELAWGEGEQFVRYTAHGGRRMRVRQEGSKQAVLLDPNRRPARGDQLTITSRRTIRGGFRQSNEYCEALLERPTGRLDFTVVFPLGHPPREASLVSAITEQVLRTLRVRYGPDGRAVLRCRLHKPAVGTTYSLRWSW